MKTKEYSASIRCHYSDTQYTQHRQILKANEIGKWIEAYRFTHPAVKAITIKIWLNEEGGEA